MNQRPGVWIGIVGIAILLIVGALVFGQKQTKPSLSVSPTPAFIPRTSPTVAPSTSPTPTVTPAPTQNPVQIQIILPTPTPTPTSNPKPNENGK